MDTYEKKYKEALELAQKLYQDCPNGKNDRLYHTTDLEKMFPELKESEDEKIKKEIISFIQDDIDEINLKVSGDYDDRDEDDIAHQIWCKKAISWLENIPYTIDHEKREGFHLGYKAGLEKQGREKPADNVESKFKVGDWITDDEAIFHITSYDINYGYQLETVNGTSFHYSDETIEKKYRLWTIQDAKDGDVLASEDNCICIFDNTVEEGKYPFAYCGLSMYGFKVYDRTLPFTHDNVYPATKEQRDLLFQKMHEAGYEWDAEKKELKEIEQKSWSEEDEEHYKACLQYFDAVNPDMVYYKDYQWLKSIKQKIGG